MRTAIVTIPRMLCDIISAVIGDLIQINIVAKFDSRDEIEKKLRTLDPDLVIVGLRPGEPYEVVGLLSAAVPAALIIAASHDGRCAVIESAQAGRVVLPDVSAVALADAIAATL